MSRLTRFVTPVGMCITNLHSMKHYRPCVPCRDKAKLQTDVNGEVYTEKYHFCDTCELKMLFNKLKHYEDLEEQGRLIELPCKVGTPIWMITWGYDMYNDKVYYPEETTFEWECLYSWGIDYFLTKEEAESKLAELKGTE